MICLKLNVGNIRFHLLQNIVLKLLLSNRVIKNNQLAYNTPSLLSHNSVIHVWPKLCGSCQKSECQYYSVLQADALHFKWCIWSWHLCARTIKQTRDGS